MRICFICSEYPPGLHGGVGVAVQIRARGLVRRGHKVKVTGIYPVSYPGSSNFCDQGVQVERMYAIGIRRSWVLDRIRLFLRIQQLVWQGWQIVEAPLDKGWFAFFPRLDAPCVVRAQKTYPEATGIGKRTGAQALYLEEKTLVRSDAWNASSQFTADMVQRVHRLASPPHSIIYNAVDILPDGDRVDTREAGLIVYAGTLTWKKGVISLIHAFNQVCQVYPESRLEVYGKDQVDKNGNSKQAILSGLQSDAARSRTLFAGHVDRSELLKRFKAASVTVFPSYGEAFGFVAVEAMALGCPVIYTRATCGPEIIEDGVDGLLIDPHDPAELAEAILRLLHDRELGIRLGLAATQTVRQRFFIDRWLDETENFYRDVLRASA